MFFSCSDFVQKLAQALMANSQCQLTTLDLSNNYIEDKGESYSQFFRPYFPPTTASGVGWPSNHLCRNNAPN